MAATYGVHVPRSLIMVSAVHLRATVFYEYIGVLATAGLARPGELAMPLGAGTTTIPLVGTADLVRVAVAPSTRRRRTQTLAEFFAANRPDLLNRLGRG